MGTAKFVSRVRKGPLKYKDSAKGMIAERKLLSGKNRLFRKRISFSTAALSAVATDAFVKASLNSDSYIVEESLAKGGAIVSGVGIYKLQDAIYKKRAIGRPIRKSLKQETAKQGRLLLPKLKQYSKKILRKKLKI